MREEESARVLVLVLVLVFVQQDRATRIGNCAAFSIAIKHHAMILRPPLAFPRIN